MYLKSSLFLFVSIGFKCLSFAQSTTFIAEKLIVNEFDSSKERDLKDFFRSKRKIVSNKEQSNKQYQLSTIPAVGYTLQTGFAGILSANLAYKTDKNPKTKLSSITTSFTYSQYHQSIIPLQADIWTKDNSYNLISDNRFVQYPSDIFGLGGRTDPNKGVTINFSGLKLHETILKAINKNLYLGLGIYYDKFWNIYAIDSLKKRAALRFNNVVGTKEIASGFAFKLLYDNRLNQLNPQNGLYADVVLRPNFTFMGSHTNWQSLLLDFRKYITYPKGSHNVLAIWNLDWLTTGGAPPYLLLPSTGWDDQYNSGRGYIQGRYRGYNMYYFETEYRYRISRNGLLGGVLFLNAQKFSGEISPQFNSVTPGCGVGLRMKLNKISGANLCVDYGFGENGSRGFFVNLGEVF